MFKVTIEYNATKLSQQQLGLICELISQGYVDGYESDLIRSVIADHLPLKKVLIEESFKERRIAVYTA